MKELLFDFSRTLLFPKNEADPLTLNQKHKQLSQEDPDYPFFEHFVLNQVLLDFIHQIKDQIPANIFTTGYIQETPALQPYLKDFVKIYSAALLGLSKQDPSSYTWIAKDLGLPPEEILFVDDSERNVEAAKKAGMQVIQYKSNGEVIEEIDRVF